MEKSVILETEILRQCLDYLSAIGIFCWRTNNMAVPMKEGGFRRFNGLKGVSDIIGILPDGRLLAVEVKRKGGKMSEYQKEFQLRIADNKGFACIVYSLDELIEDLKEIGF